MRTKTGRFGKGYTYRKPKPYWNKDWLVAEYVTKRKSASEIAGEQNCIENNILYFLHKHRIKSRTIAQARSVKHWGLSGKQNGMYGRTGRLNPRWNGGHSPERQSSYARAAWKELAKAILKRDAYACTKCGITRTTKNRLIVHHKKHWSKHLGLRFESKNLLTLCEQCHKLKHGKRR